MITDIYGQVMDCALGIAASAKVSDCAIGSRCIAVQMDAGVGLAYMTVEGWATVLQRGAAAVERSILGKAASALILAYRAAEPLGVGIALATINSFLIDNGQEEHLDWPTVLADKKCLGMIGFFRPLMERIRSSGIETRIFELLPIPGTFSPHEAPELLPACDVVLATGAMFANKTIHHYLPYIAPSAHSFILGHSTPLADPLFPFFSLGSSKVLDAARLMPIIRKGAGMRDLREALCKVFRPQNTTFVSKAG